MKTQTKNTVFWFCVPSLSLCLLVCLFVCLFVPFLFLFLFTSLLVINWWGMPCRQGVMLRWKVKVSWKISPWRASFQSTFWILLLSSNLTKQEGASGWVRSQVSGEMSLHLHNSVPSPCSRGTSFTFFPTIQNSSFNSYSLSLSMLHTSPNSFSFFMQNTHILTNFHCSMHLIDIHIINTA